MLLQKTPAIERLAADLAHVPPDWDAIRKAAGEAAHFASSRRERQMDIGFVAELYISCALRAAKIAGNHPLAFDPIPDGARAGEYLFLQHDHRVEVRRQHIGARGRRRGTYDQVGDLDILVVVDGAPTIAEVKAADMERGGKGNGPRRIFAPDYLSRVTAPVREYFGQDPAMMVFVPSDCELGAGIQEEFRNRGGVIVPFYCDRETFRADATKILEDSLLSRGTARGYARPQTFGLGEGARDALASLRERLS